MDIPWKRAALARSMPSMSLADPAMDEGRGLSLAVTFNPARAEKLFAGSGHTLGEILEADAAHKPLPRFPIPGGSRARWPWRDPTLVHRTSSRFYPVPTRS